MKGELIDFLELFLGNGTGSLAASKTKVDICYIYFIFDGAFFKIGHSKKPTKRLSDLQVGCSDKHLHIGCLIRLPNKDYAVALEKELHQILTNHANVHLRGEWFDLFDEKDSLLQACMFYCAQRVIGNLDLDFQSEFNKFYDEDKRTLDLVPLACMPE